VQRYGIKIIVTINNMLKFISRKIILIKNLSHYAFFIQPGEPVYCQNLEKDALKSALQQVDISKCAENLAQADELARPYF
jgi:hypothetical protein